MSKGSAGTKVVAALVCLLFALPFSGVGLFAIGYMGYIAWQVNEGRDWVRVKAEALSKNGPVSYRYTVGGKQYYGSRLTFGSVNEGDALTAEAEERFAAAYSAGKPFTVYVNPGDPSKAVIERSMPWMLLVFLTPFALGFGGVGLGAFWMLAKVLRDEPEKPGPATGPRKSEARAGLIGTWVFAILWNSIAIPAALLAVPQALASHEYVMLFVLIFPLVGVFVLWAALSATWGYVRRGGAILHLNPENPRVGSAVQGFIAFPRGVAAGEAFKVKLLCIRAWGDGDGGTNKETRWTREHTLRTTATPNGVRLPFRIDVPYDACRAKGRDAHDDGEFKWRIEAAAAEAKRALPYAFEITVLPAPEDVMEKAEALAPEDEPQLATLGPGFAKLEQLAAERGIRMNPGQREQLAKLTASQRELAAQALQLGPKIRKWVIWIVVAVVAFQVLAAIVAVVGAMAFS